MSNSKNIDYKIAKVYGTRQKYADEADFFVPDNSKVVTSTTD